MTLGNLLRNPRAGVLFIDFDSGDLLSLTGSAEAGVGRREALQAFEGVERAWRLRIEAGWRLRDALAAALEVPRLVAQLADHRHLGRGGTKARGAAPGAKLAALPRAAHRGGKQRDPLLAPGAGRRAAGPALGTPGCNSWCWQSRNARARPFVDFDDHEFFLCGPTGFMQALYDGLRDLGVRDERIQAEAFGPASLKRRPDGAAQLTPPPALAAQHATVVFRQSGEAADWTPERGTLLEFAEGKGLSPAFSCRAGHCGSCATPLLSGRVTYAEPTAWRPADGEVLLCCARPAQDGGEHIELAL